VINNSSKKDFKRNAHSTANLLRELEISLRTNHVGWVKEFLTEHNGLDALVDFLKFACWGLVASTINVKVRRKYKKKEQPKIIKMPKNMKIIFGHFSEFLKVFSRVLQKIKKCAKIFKMIKNIKFNIYIYI